MSKYEHRSNGGIPIFSEERLQERREKVWSKFLETLIMLLCEAEGTTTRTTKFIQARIPLKGQVMITITNQSNDNSSTIESENTTTMETKKYAKAIGANQGWYQGQQ